MRSMTIHLINLSAESTVGKPTEAIALTVSPMGLHTLSSTALVSRQSRVGRCQTSTHANIRHRDVLKLIDMSLCH